MLRAALSFFILALLAFAIGATGFAGLSMDIAKILIAVFVVLAVLSGLVHILRGGHQ
jgi:uncharacterized membrane protein YtjA (UPF0391 family)